jgi:hypothetical protein
MRTAASARFTTHLRACFFSGEKASNLHLCTRWSATSPPDVHYLLVRLGLMAQLRGRGPVHTGPGVRDLVSDIVLTNIMRVTAVSLNLPAYLMS